MAVISSMFIRMLPKRDAFLLAEGCVYKLRVSGLYVRIDALPYACVICLRLLCFRAVIIAMCVFIMLTSLHIFNIVLPLSVDIYT